MLGKGNSGVVNEATNQIANENLTNTIEYMSTAAYRKTRDESDVIPTHRKPEKIPKRDNGVPVYNPESEKEQQRQEAQNDGEGDDDEELAFLRERRMAAMRKQQEKQMEWVAKQHGSYREIGQDDFFNVVVRDKGGSDDVCVHFYHKDFDRCKIMDRHLGELAMQWLPVKFCKIDVEKAPFLVDKLKVTVLPCLVLFHNDVAVDRVVGFDELGNSDSFAIETLKARIEHGLHGTEE